MRGGRGVSPLILPHLPKFSPGPGPLRPDYPTGGPLQLGAVEGHLLLQLGLQQSVALVVHYTDVDDLLSKVFQYLPELAVLIIGPGQTGGDVMTVLMIVREPRRYLGVGVALTNQPAPLPVLSCHHSLVSN